jgi:hypothetical protein
MNSNSSTTPPPALTWTHLVPSTAEFHCTSAPDWFAAELAAISVAGAPRVDVLWNDAAIPFDRVAACDAIVAINSRNFPCAQLQTAGYTYLRHFAVLPSLKNARWFVPLDSPAVSSAAMSLYTPSRLSAKLKRGAVRLAMHARLPIWYHDHVWIAQREAPPIEAALNPLFPGQDVRWALSSGAPEGARNRKASALMLAPDGEMLAFVKLARSAIARQILGRETDVLNHLSRFTEIAESVPRVLFTGEMDDVRVLAQTPLQGSPAPIGLTRAHLSFLQSMQTSLTVRAADTATASEMGGRLESLGRSGQPLLAIWDDVLPVLREFDVPITIVHGDFAPWNLRLDKGRLGAFDWEYGEPHGLPLMDEIHYRLQCGWLLDEWGTLQGFKCLLELMEQHPYGLQAGCVEAIAKVYLLDALARLLGEGYDEQEDVIKWHRGVLNRLVSYRTKYLEAAVA